MDDKPYLTLSGVYEQSISPIKGSRFIGIAAPISSDAEALAFVAQSKARYPDARHWCWAYQLREQQRTRFADDGEPSGSAGKPILAPIVGRELFDTLVVVVRYFGGTKLGVGGLVRAYSQAANTVLAQANVMGVIPKITLMLRYDYSETAAVASALATLNLTEETPTYTDKVHSTLQVIPDAVDETSKRLTDYTHGKVYIAKPDNQ